MAGFKAFWTRIRERRAENKSSRARILLWSTVIALIFGGIEFGQPVDDLLRTMRNKARVHSASGDIVVVGIDDRSLSKINQWPWPRRHQARLADQLASMGAKRILFDLDMSTRSSAEDDRAFAEALSRLGQRVTLAVRFIVDPVTLERRDNLPIPAFRKHVHLAHINFRYSPMGAVWKIPYALKYGGEVHPSFAASMAGTGGEADEVFPVDYSINPRSIPAVSAIDVIDGSVSPDQIAGKTVVVGAASADLGDLYTIPGYGRMSGVYVHVVGAETLKQGVPSYGGWLLPFLLAFLFAAAAIRLRDLRAITVAFSAAVAAYLLVPLLLEANLIFIEIMPALFLLTSVGGRVAWAGFKRSYREQGTINTVSGLPNLNALRQEKQGRNCTLIAARIQNYAEVASALPPDQEKGLVDQIAARLSIGAVSHKLYHGDEGIFAWLVDPGVSRSVGEHLDALHALFRSPVVVGDTQVDLAITFGFDAGSERSLSNRLASALVASDEAAAEGLRWKEYDPAKLKDAPWRLSLLSQLDGAIESGDLWIAYQPKLDLGTNTIIGAEALVRWTHPEKGPISPLEFILAAEQSDRIEKLTMFVLDGAIAAAAAVNRRGIDFQVSVNLSARLIDHPGLSKAVTDLLAKHELSPSRLSLELTETAAITSTGSSLNALLELRYLGVDISIDDYGTGMSTLDYLKRVPATEIKIDKSFVQAIEKSHSDRLLVHSTIQLAHSLGQKVVAEGVEDSATLKALQRMGCDLAQGYLIGRPMNFHSLLKHLAAHEDHQAASTG